MRAGTQKHTHTHTHTHRGKGKTDYSVAGEGMTKRATNGPFGTFCHPAVTKRVGLTNCAGSASNLTRFLTLVTNRTVVTLLFLTAVVSSCAHDEQIRLQVNNT